MATHRQSVSAMLTTRALLCRRHAPSRARQIIQLMPMRRPRQMPAERFLCLPRRNRKKPIESSARSNRLPAQLLVASVEFASCKVDFDATMLPSDIAGRLYLRGSSRLTEQPAAPLNGQAPASRRLFGKLAVPSSSIECKRAPTDGISTEFLSAPVFGVPVETRSRMIAGCLAIAPGRLRLLL